MPRDQGKQAPKQKRPYRPRLRMSCLTCQTRRIKYDEGKPAYARCTQVGWKCEGYESKPLFIIPYDPPTKASMIPRELASGPTVNSSIETRALEFFFHKTAPQLAGYFEGAFFQGCVLQVSLAEPAIRQATAAIAAMHEQMPRVVQHAKQSLDLNVPIQLYNRAIRAIIEKSKTDPDAIHLIAMANILFICFELLQGSMKIAQSHLRNGIQILISWNKKSKSSDSSCDRKSGSFESNFMKTKVAPLLNVFRFIILNKDTSRDVTFLLNPINDYGDVSLGEGFDTIQQARTGLLDVITHASMRFDKINECNHKLHAKEERAQILNSVERSLVQWEANWDDLVRRQSSSWDSKQKQAVNALRILRLDTSFETRSYLADGECTWDAARSEYEEALGLIEAHISDGERVREDRFRPLSLDFGMIYCHHTLAWKCRWPRLRRRALELLRRIHGTKMVKEAERYYMIFSRIMEIEEADLHFLPNEIPAENILPPESARIHHFSVRVQSPPVGLHNYAVTFWSKPHGLDGPWHSVTELMHLGSCQPGESAVPVNLINRYFTHPDRLEPIAGP
ncbi:hypothetical protein N7457_000531 [Penicillium paradoxum]|uniref:uncharacterized protein n=1 Tax=Penicillium paradoxum TaxID=176176 RepID=UPI0025468D18|nr:uncharacterized protein N7457_000531 [Penicillium paradoxum]KAJ5793932.1 hypothetical protein N7457_000531 [Penicillium paradoxum]